MGYFYDEFAGVTLPKGVPRDSNNLTAKVNISPFKEGAYNADWGVQTFHQGQSITHSAILFDPLTSDIEAAADALRALVGTENLLQRRRIRSRDIQFTLAILNSATSNVAVNNRNHVQITQQFTQLSSVWYGDLHDITDAIQSDGDTISLPNNGNARVTNPIITITLSSTLPATSTLTLTIARPERGVNLTLTDSFLANDVVIVNAGSWSFTKNGAPITDYTLSDTDHKIREVISLEKGANLLSLSATPALPLVFNITTGMYMGFASPVTYSQVFNPGSTTMQVVYNDGWN